MAAHFQWHGGGIAPALGCGGESFRPVALRRVRAAPQLSSILRSLSRALMELPLYCTITSLPLTLPRPLHQSHSIPGSIAQSTFGKCIKAYTAPLDPVLGLQTRILLALLLLLRALDFWIVRLGQHNLYIPS